MTVPETSSASIPRSTEIPRGRQRRPHTYQTKDGLPTNQLLSITKESVNGGGISTIYTAGEYDGVGNPCKYRGNVLKWKRGRILKAYGGNEYRYDGNGIRQEKRTAGGAVHKYYTSGGKILGEEVSENGTVTTYRYEYLGDRVVGLVKNNTEKYYYQYNAVGDIARICDEDGKTAARYEYGRVGEPQDLRQERSGNHLRRGNAGDDISV